ncbi:MAG TPA: hypothetical protein VFQ00_10310 [Terriglobales bacterium]|nr:hypothetical protein [Terriglobales bacterium]
MNQGDWKKIVMYGAFGAAAYFLLSGKRSVGMATAGVGLAVLAADNPEKFEQIWNQAPEYLERGHRIVNGIQSLVERISEHAQSWQQMRTRMGEVQNKPY